MFPLQFPLLKVFLYTLVTITLLKIFSRSLHLLSKIFVVKKFDSVSVLAYTVFHFLSEKDVLKKTEVTGDVKERYIKDVGGGDRANFRKDREIF